MNNYRGISNEEFIEYINKLYNGLESFIKQKDLKIDYICPILRSGGVPAIYLSNMLNVVKFAPIQVKHITYKNGEDKIEMLFNPFNAIQIKKEKPVFLVVEALQSTGISVEMCINEIKNKYKNATILYVCIAKEYGSKDFENDTIYEDTAFYYNGNNNLNEDECKKMNIEYLHPLFPWEDLDMEQKHPDDLEENIFF